MRQLPQIERSTDLPAPPAEVWERIVDGDLAEEWMGVRVEPRRGGGVSVPDRDVIGTVEEVVPGESITWSWREVDGEPSQVSIVLTPTEDGTRLTITERLLEYRITGHPPIFLNRAA
ncbi:MAG: SRPBCC family protein [Acidimicrobiia bacterium]